MPWRRPARPRSESRIQATNVTVITLDEAPQGYKDFDKGAAKKFVLDPHHSISRN